jgi:hypothetical protein
MHGGGTPQAKAKATEFKLRGRDIACGVLLDAMNAEPCEACGRTRDMVVAVRAAIAVLDRTGMPASLTVHHTHDVDLSALSLEEMIAEVEATLASLRGLQAQQHQRELEALMEIEGESVIESESRDAALDDVGDV